ncbi:transcriptional regulator PpsR [Roseibium sp. RKSG952]|uniref:transcriptional regulator PpsR n=1 Tax=Roseibium sp. RKSG952 TaxID=2529384 RepID=UPI0012BCA1D3|nr:transcriptional regulator PpsR [Roseibium sp. RKSG952]MTH98802.1 transcriptional regulator PpsR [Roseibium sp. RKSG952]
MMPDGKMEKQPSKPTHCLFRQSEEIFGNLPAHVAMTLAAHGADLTLLVSPEGYILDAAYGDPALDAYAPQSWAGKPLKEVVTQECLDKVDALFDECFKHNASRPHQINHARTGGPDLPVEYTLVRIDGFPALLALGKDLRRFAEIQQQLMRAQFELEREYRRIRETEARYRVIFHKMEWPVLVLDGDQRKVLDANTAAASALQTKPAKLTGETLAALVDRNDRDTVLDALASAREKGTGRKVHAHLNAIPEPFSLHVDPFRESGKINYLLSLSQSDSSLAASGTSHIAAEWIDTIPEAVVILDDRGIVLAVNDRFLDLVHILNKTQLAGRNANNWIGASNVDMQVLLARLQEEGEVNNFMSVLRDALGDSRQIRINAVRDLNGGETTTVLLLSEQVARETQLRVHATDRTAETSDFAELIGRVPLKELIRESVDVIEKLCIEAALRQTENNRASAADLLGLSRQSLYIKLKRHRLEDFDGTA